MWSGIDKHPHRALTTGPLWGGWPPLHHSGAIRSRRPAAIARRRHPGGR